MTTRDELLEQWQDGLAEADRASERGVTWSDRLRIKLYRFLLSMYGQSTWPGEPSDVDNEQGRARSTLTVDKPPDHGLGKAPRTRAEILAGLRNVKGLSEELAPPGPLQQGLEPDSPVVVAANRKRAKIEPLVRHLRSLGVEPEVRFAGSLWQVFVPHRNAAYAAQEIAEFTPPPPPPMPVIELKCSRSSLSGVVLFGFIGSLLSVQFAALLVGEASNQSTATAWIAVVGTAAAVFDMLFLLCLYWDVQGYFAALKKCEQRERLEKEYG
ncbi:hypothetical protein ETAA8_52640 [Anatilimnocola aggregata]|uniref:Uncharacterized protein n=1 Tax=Anatilimnocola aggregata TaxID=2528021 RepID=A0A517YIV8_9BACT|nr:hypothetical protein [Anatilimnocola aggregata]QDU30145.1 hypothetical protein ETAA8_52640 [Anatilimnocola aggregata]